MAIRFCLLENKKYVYGEKLNHADNFLAEKSNILRENNKISTFALELNSSIFYEASKYLNLHTEIEYIPVIDKNDNFICFCYKDVEHEKLREIVMELCTFNKVLDFRNFYPSHSKIVLWGVNENAYYFHKFLCQQHVKHYIVGEFWKYICDDYYPDFEKNDKNINIFFEGNFALPVNESAYGRIILERFNKDHFPIFNFYKKCCEYSDILDYQDSRDAIVSYINSDIPFFMRRVGNTELSILKEYFEKKKGVLSHYSPFWIDYLYNCCGFFGNPKGIICDSDIDKYAELTLAAIKNCDVNMCWGDDDVASGLSFILDEYQKDGALRVSWDDFNNPGGCYDIHNGVNALYGKKVLVVSPFVSTINKQNQFRDKIYKGDKKFPTCELILYKAPETQMGNYNGFCSWFEVFEKVLLDIRCIEFDIALIGAGAYGFPLAYEIKKLGKKAISLSSYLANWFGIKMKRYCAYTPINKNWNKYWCFPEEVPPKGFENIEDGCYWR